MKKLIQWLNLLPGVSQPLQNPDEKEFTFIWYKKIQTGNKTHFTQPFRTKIKAKTRNEAIEKLKCFVLNKTELCIIDEKDFDRCDIGRIQKSFDDMNKNFQDLFNKFETFKH